STHPHTPFVQIIRLLCAMISLSYDSFLCLAGLRHLQTTHSGMFAVEFAEGFSDQWVVQCKPQHLAGKTSTFRIHLRRRANPSKKGLLKQALEMKICKRYGSRGAFCLHQFPEMVIGTQNNKSTWS